MLIKYDILKIYDGAIMGESSWPYKTQNIRVGDMVVVE